MFSKCVAGVGTLIFWDRAHISMFLCGSCAHAQRAKRKGGGLSIRGLRPAIAGSWKHVHVVRPFSADHDVSGSGRDAHDVTYGVLRTPS